MSEETYRFFDLTGRVALVTGGGSGLGRSFCEILAEFGADVVCADIYADRAEETCANIKKYGHRTLPVGVDISDYDQVRAMFRQIADTFGKLDIAVNNAGISTPGALIHQMEPDEWHRVLNVNLHGTFYCMKESLAIMVKHQTGCIINISSTAALRATGYRPNVHYVASKHGIIGLTKHAAVEYATMGIRVNCIAPGNIGETRLSENSGIQRSEAQQQQALQRIPMRRAGHPQELKGLLLYLASDSSSFVTGQVFVVDGGATA
jgi:NAD(P)-dependent dehydrogenase (short-subunit alcohol dehydrogenase family)